MKKISYLSGLAEEPLLGMTIGECFDNIVSKFPNNDALVSIHQNHRYTYQELSDVVTKISKSFIKIGVKKGDRVGIWAPNCSEWLITQISTAKIGAVLVNINPSYRSNELSYSLKQSGCSVLVTAHKFKTSDYTNILNGLIPEIKHNTNKKEIKSKKFPKLNHIVTLSESEKKGMILWNDFVTIGKDIEDKELKNIEKSLDFDDPINIQYTSGTTGYPKGATLSHHNILNNGHLVTKLQNFTNKDRLVIPVPLYHCFGMVMGNLGCISKGATMIYSGYVFDPEAVLKAIEKEKATALYGVPTMFFSELNFKDFKKYNLKSLRTGLMAGSLCPSELMKRVNSEMNIKEMQIAYGMTETSPVSTQTGPDASFEKSTTTVGKVLPFTEIKIIDPKTKKIVEIGEKGELCTRGYCVMIGYWNDEERTKQSIKEGWMHTGDLASMDEEGYISITGRLKDMIIRGGENVYPKEIEEFLYKNPKVKEVQVIGVPDDKYGEEICAWVQIKENEQMTIDEVKEYCKGNIAHFKIPRYIKFVNDFPLTVTGKIRKVDMRKQTIQELGLVEG